jgi:septal ring factor EnvC (AmiA/AmiB activator)
LYLRINCFQKDDRIQQVERQLLSYNRNSESMFASQQRLADDRAEFEKKIEQLEHQVNSLATEKATNSNSLD